MGLAGSALVLLLETPGPWESQLVIHFWKVERMLCSILSMSLFLNSKAGELRELLKPSTTFSSIMVSGRATL